MNSKEPVHNPYDGAIIECGNCFEPLDASWAWCPSCGYEIAWDQMRARDDEDWERHLSGRRAAPWT